MDRNNLIQDIKDKMKKLLKMEETVEETVETEVEVKFSEVITMDGTKLVTDSDDITTGIEIWTVDENNNRVPAEPGEYKLEDGRTIIVKDNKIEEIKEVDEKQGEDSPVEDANVIENTEVIVEESPEEEEVKEGEDMGMRLDKLEADVASILEILTQMSQYEKQLDEKFEAFSKSPGVNTETKASKPLSDQEKFIKRLTEMAERQR